MRPGWGKRWSRRCWGQTVHHVHHGDGHHHGHREHHRHDRVRRGTRHGLRHGHDLRRHGIHRRHDRVPRHDHGKHTVAVELDVDLLLALALTLGLGTLAGHVGLLLFFAAQSLALGELLAAALVGLADVLGGEAELLLGLLNKVGSVGLAPVLWLGLGLVLALSSVSDGILLFSLGNGIASYFVLELSVAVVSAPAVSSLLLLLTVTC
ncbi:hypothetical protein HBH56_163650 [Parastagonospora nodorum]|nr:hypothetical protein HBH56_163650 [Parastagonospora nodorum]KAH3968996.1 hypothetical protein HBH52_177030 [Parastagonospora nodorum]KAH3993918.1 hypothetical protein HBI10_197450 [Parastagonospora nodorum]KAH4044803.1 hypothetical protein HBH49_213410 [Parastagonospora nodorum]KAH4064418.1 hypothetical protein HBH50_178960 [Parastagonospora nodorum]